jgi:hypothetical protein
MPRRAVITVAVACLGLSIGCVALYAHFVRKRAESLVLSAVMFSSNANPFPVAALRQQYGSRLKESEGCTASECNYEVVVSNRLLATLHLVPYTELKSNFWVRNGEVFENMLDYTTTVHHRSTITVHSAIQFGEGSFFFLHPWDDSTSVDTNGLATISSGSTDLKKQAVLALNTSCVTRMGGCTTVAELLPTIWEQTGKGTIRCRVPNREGMVDRPASWTWMKLVRHIAYHKQSGVAR